ncbi:MAG: FtsX-like permease family protein, partial [bacterium]|nr:FtsX-like permease family protein [bacterium]
RYTTLTCGEKAFKNEPIYATDQNFFKVFTFPLSQGDPDDALSRPNTAVITEETAQRYFGSDDPMGKIIILLAWDSGWKEFPLEVTGVFENIPENSHFKFNMLLSTDTIGGLKVNDDWGRNSFVSYLLLRDGVSLERGNEILYEIANNDLTDQATPTWTLQPMKDIHLHSDLASGREPNGSIVYVYLFSIIALLILVTACVNFMNLSSARFTSRAKEIGIRKVVGSGKVELIKQFLGESVLICSFAMVIALILVELSLLPFGNLVGRRLDIFFLEEWFIIPGIICFTVLIGIVAGIYPAFYLSSLKVVDVIKNSITKGKRSGSENFRNVLIVFQFAVSIFLITGTVVIYNQLSYFQNKRLGFNKDQIIIVHQTDHLEENVPVFKELLSSNPEIQEVTSSAYLMGEGFVNYGMRLGEIYLRGKNNTLDITVCDHHFLDVFDIEMARGRFFSEDFPGDDHSIILNEEAVRYFELNEPVGKKITVWGFDSREFTVIGVVKDFHYESLHSPIGRMALALSGSHPIWIDQYVSVKVRPDKIAETIRFIENEWEKVSAGLQFKYSFFDEEYESRYNSEMLVGKVAFLFSGLAIFISIIGLFGLAAFMAAKRTKEIGVRKVLGATVPSILNLISKEFIILIFIANIIAWPAAYIMMNSWLQQFAYRIELGFSIFLISSLIAFSIAIITVSYQSMKAAYTNPVDSLRYE